MVIAKYYRVAAVQLLVLLCFAMCMYFLEETLALWRIKPAERKAAIAIRDNVIPFQKYGTRLFTLPYLKKGYSEVVYLTTYEKEEKKKEFIEGLTRLLENNDAVDIFLLAHGNSYYRWVEEIDTALRKKIRLVYNTGCSGAQQALLWQRLGARSYVAHISEESISPVFYFYFLRRWAAGRPLAKAAAEANLQMLHNLEKLHTGVPATVLNQSMGICFGQKDYTLHE